MRKSTEFQIFGSVINAIDIADATKNQIMVWASTERYEHSVEFTTFGKPRRVLMILKECEAVTTYCKEMNGEDLGSYDIFDTDDYKEVAERIINFLRNGDI